MIKKILILVICFIIGFEGMANANATTTVMSLNNIAIMSAVANNNRYNSYSRRIKISTIIKALVDIMKQKR